MVKFENNKCQMYDKNKGLIITTVEIAPKKILPLEMSFEKKNGFNLND